MITHSRTNTRTLTHGVGFIRTHYFILDNKSKDFSIQIAFMNSSLKMHPIRLHMSSDHISVIKDKFDKIIDFFSSVIDELTYIKYTGRRCASSNIVIKHDFNPIKYSYSGMGVFDATTTTKETSVTLKDCDYSTTLKVQLMHSLDDYKHSDVYRACHLRNKDFRIFDAYMTYDELIEVCEFIIKTIKEDFYELFDLCDRIEKIHITQTIIDDQLKVINNLRKYNPTLFTTYQDDGIEKMLSTQLLELSYIYNRIVELSSHTATPTQEQ